MRGARTVGGFVVAALLLGACGGDDDSTTSETTSESTSETTAGESEGPDEPDAADQAAARDALLTLTDLPEGWTQSAPEADTGGDPLEEGDLPPDCGYLQGIDTIGTTTAEETSNDFSAPDDAASASSEVTAWTEEAAADEAFASFSRAKTVECVEAAFTDLAVSEIADPTLEVGAVEATPVTIDLGDDAFGIKVSIEAVADGTPITLLFEIDAARVGRSVSTLTTFGIDQEVDPDGALLAVLVERAAPFSATAT